MKVEPDALRAAVVQAGGVEREAKGSGELWRYELDDDDRLANATADERGELHLA